MDKFSPKDEKAKPVAAATGAPVADTPASFATGGDKSETLRVAGEVVLHGERWILLSNQDGTVRLENPAVFVGSGLTTVGNVEGKRVATWTGAAKKSQSIVGSGN